MKSTLGTVIGLLLQADDDLANDPMSAAVGFDPDPLPILTQLAMQHGWTMRDILAELDRRGVSAHWCYVHGIGAWEDGTDPDEPVPEFAGGLLS